MNYDIKIIGLKELEEKLGYLPRNLKMEIGRAVYKSALLVEAESKPITPVDTGRLRASISSDIRPMMATIAPHTEYAIYVHEGTRYMKGRPFMTKGTKRALPKIKLVFQEAVKKCLR